MYMFYSQDIIHASHFSLAHVHMALYICMAEMYAEVKFQKHLKNLDELKISLPKAVPANAGKVEKFEMQELEVGMVVIGLYAFHYFCLLFRFCIIIIPYRKVMCFCGKVKSFRLRPESYVTT